MNFKEHIKNWLEEEIKNDEFLAKKYDVKKLDDCIKYIYTEVQKDSGRPWLNMEVYDLAKHFFLEDGKVEIDKSVSTPTIVETQEELSEEDIAKAKKNAEKRFKNDLEAQKKINLD